MFKKCFSANIKHLSTALFATLFFLISHVSNAQKNFLDGFVITAEGDTVRGQIDYRNWVINPSEISFKAADGKENVLRSVNIIGFQAGGDYYQSAAVQIETSPHLTNQLNSTSALRYEQRFVFLQALVLGEKSLYHLKDEKAKDHFYIRVGDEFRLLLYKRYLEGRFVLENKTYQGQLATYLSDCNKVNGWVRATNYNKKNLIQLFKKYYQCSTNETNFAEEAENLKTQIRAIAGLSLTSTSFSSKSENPIALSDFDQSVSLALGLSAEIYFARNLGRLSIQNELFFSNYSMTGNVTIEDEMSFSTSVYDSELSFSYLKMNNMFRYNFNTNNASFFLGIGISNGFAINSTNFTSRTVTLFNNTRIIESAAVDPSRNYEQGLLFGLGLKKGKYAVELRYERSNGMSNGDGLTSTINRLFLLFAYQL